MGVYVRSLSLIVAAAGSLSSSCATTPSSSDELMEVVRTVARVAEVVDTVWPGYRLFEAGFIVYQPGRALLVTSQTPPSEWVPVESASSALRGRVYQRAGSLPGLPKGISTSYRVGQQRLTAVDYDGALKETLVTLYHEGFHWFQDSAFAEQEASEFFPAAAVTPAQLASIQLERRILAAALEADTRARLDSLIALVAAVRNERMRSLTDSVAAADRKLERMEGSAHLMGYRGAAAALGLPQAHISQALRSELQADLDRVAGDAASQYYRWRVYATGAAIGVLLDRLGIAWENQIAAGVPFDSLLLRAAGPRAITDHAMLLSAARAQFDYSQLLANMQRSAPAQTGDRIAQFLASQPYRLVIEMTGGPTFAPSASFQTGDGGMIQAHPEVLLLPDAGFSMVNPAFEIKIENRPIMMDTRDAPKPYRLVVMLAERPEVTGSNEAGWKVTTARVDITAKHLELADTAGGVFTIRLRAE